MKSEDFNEELIRRIQKCKGCESPFEEIRSIKHIICATAREIQTTLRRRHAQRPQIRIGLLASLTAAVARGDSTAIYKAVRDLPELKRFFEIRRGCGITRARVISIDELHECIRAPILDNITQQIHTQPNKPRPQAYIDRLWAWSRRWLPFRRALKTTAYIDKEAHIITSDIEATAALTRYWAATFAHKQHHPPTAVRWCAQYVKPIDKSLLLPLDYKLVHAALRAAKHKSPGPDGIRDTMWSYLAPYATDMFMRAYVGGEALANINESLAVYPQRKS